jgi:integrase
MPHRKKRADGRYEAKVNVGVRPNGTYIRKSVFARTVSELDELVREARNQTEQGVDIAAQKPAVKAWADKWLEVYKADLARSMRDNYASMIKKWLDPIHSARIDKIRQIQLQEILQNASKELSQSSIDKLYNCICGIFKTARQNGITANDITEFLIKPTGGAKSQRDALTPEEQNILRDVCAGQRHGLLPMLLMYAGLRLGEALALTYGDIKNGYINVNKTVVHEEISNKSGIKNSSKTAAGVRRVPVAPPLEPFIAAALSSDNIIHLDSAYIFEKNGVLFSCTVTRRAWRAVTEAFNTEWNKRRAPEHDIDLSPPPRKITAHMLRHTFVTILYDAGIDIKTAQKWAGHSSVSVTMDIYTHLSAKKETEAETKFIAHLTPPESDDKIDDNCDDFDDKKAIIQ